LFFPTTWDKKQFPDSSSHRSDPQTALKNVPRAQLQWIKKSTSFFFVFFFLGHFFPNNKKPQQEPQLFFEGIKWYAFQKHGGLDFSIREKIHYEAAESSKECPAGLFGSFEIQLQDMRLWELTNF